MKYIKRAARVLNRNCVNKRGLDLSKKVLWVSVGQRAAEIRAVKVGGLTNILLIGPCTGKAGSNWVARQYFFLSPTLQPVTLLLFDLQRPTVPLWKDLNLFT